MNDRLVISMSAGGVGRLTNPDKWRAELPKSLFDALELWMQHQGFNLTHYRWLAGQSGCHVALVQLNPAQGMTHGAVLKFLPPELATQESQGISLAEQLSPDGFFQAHMVKTRAMSLPDSRWALHLQETAYTDLSRSRQLAELVEDADFAFYCDMVISAIADRWNGGHADPLPQPTTIAEFLRHDLEPKWDHLAKFAVAVGLDPALPDVLIPGRRDRLPNPLAAIVSGAWESEEVMVFRGNGHGDLNLRNILVCTGTETFRLIDYGRFSPETPISRDPAKLLLSAAEQWLPEFRVESRLRSRLAELVVMPHASASSPQLAGYLKVARLIHKAAAEWARVRDLGEPWARQHLLTLIATALRTVARNTLSIPDRLWFFEVAAHALSELLVGPLARHVSTTPGISLVHRESWGSDQAHWRPA